MKGSKKSNSAGNSKIYSTKYQLVNKSVKFGKGKSTNKTI